VLGPAASGGTPIVVLEPSCWSVLRDEINGMFPDEKPAHAIMEHTFLLGEFLEKQAKSYQPPKLQKKAMMHAHCHHKAIVRGAKNEETLLERMELDVKLLTSGCCGMAGSFGFEEDKYDVSVAVGEHSLLPAVREAAPQTMIIADGFSCREQIEQTTNRHALHLAEVIQSAIKHGPHGPDGMLPESEFIEPHKAAVRKSKIRAGVALGAVAGAGIGAWLWSRRRA
jgi:Fe-S oxidoreductase